MAFRVITDADGGAETFDDDDTFTVGTANGALQVERADGRRILFSPCGGWLRIEADPPRNGVY